MAPYRKRKAVSVSSNHCGEFPESGAIFMSSNATKEECLQRNLFGLPLVFADFVKAVKPGMTLFLFEYESRRLYGVFEAVSDGKMNTVPHAFRSSSSPKSFPAQVCVRVIFDCLPLSEDVFGKAIRENYFQKHKFNFGLSRQQVDRLLLLFERVGVEKPLVRKNLELQVTKESRYYFRSEKRHSRTSAEHKESDEFNTRTASSLGELVPLRESKQVSMHEQVKHVEVTPTCSLVLGDYIPLSSPHCCNIEVKIGGEVSVKAPYSGTPEQRRITSSHLNLHLQHATTCESEDNCGTFDEGFSMKVTYSDLVPKFVRRKEQNVCEADQPVNKMLEMGDIVSKRGQIKSSERVSVFSRLTYA